jgi:predicted membrane protein (TIGR00267 family)
MRTVSWILNRQNRFDLIAGLCDGVLTALTLAAGKLIDSDSLLTVGLSIRVAIAAAIPGAFVFFVSHYAVLRGELVEAERQLSMTAHGRLTSSRLGKAALREATGRAVLASASSFCGALLPLIVGSGIPGFRWLAIAVALAFLALLGTFLGRTVYGQPLRWGGGMLFSGAALAYVGLHLKIV